jgi:hypothetical protein
MYVATAWISKVAIKDVIIADNTPSLRLFASPNDRMTHIGHLVSSMYRLGRSEDVKHVVEFHKGHTGIPQGFLSFAQVPSVIESFSRVLISSPLWQQHSGTYILLLKPYLMIEVSDIF